MRPPFLFSQKKQNFLLQPPLLFLSAKEKEERPAGVEEKEGFSPSVCPATPTGAVHLS